MDFLLHSNFVWFILIIVLGFQTRYRRQRAGLPVGYWPAAYFVMGGVGLILVALHEMMK